MINMSEEKYIRRKRKQPRQRRGRERYIFLSIRITPQENEDLSNKIQRANITKSEFVRRAIANAVINEKPDREFYEAMKQMIRIGNNLNQLTKKANSLNFIDIDEYKKQSQDWNKFMNEVKKKYL